MGRGDRNDIDAPHALARALDTVRMKEAQLTNELGLVRSELAAVRVQLTAATDQVRQATRVGERAWTPMCIAGRQPHAGAPPLCARTRTAEGPQNVRLAHEHATLRRTSSDLAAALRQRDLALKFEMSKSALLERDATSEDMLGAPGGGAAGWRPELEALKALCAESLQAMETQLAAARAATAAAEERAAVAADKARSSQAEREAAAGTAMVVDNAAGAVLARERDRAVAHATALEKQVALLEAQVSRGDHVLATTKVLHLRMNPVQQVEAKRRAELEENERSAAVLARRAESAAPVTRALERQVLDLQKTHAHMKQIFAEKVARYREAVYLLIGYHVDMDGDTVVLRSMFAERKADDVRFRRVEAGGVHYDLVPTPFLTTVAHRIQPLLARRNALPAVTATVTLELFERQTAM